MQNVDLRQCATTIVSSSESSVAININALWQCFLVHGVHGILVHGSMSSEMVEEEQSVGMWADYIILCAHHMACCFIISCAHHIMYDGLETTSRHLN